MRTITFTRSINDVITEVPATEASFMTINGVGNEIVIRPETNQDWNRVFSMLKAYSDLEKFQRYVLPEPGLVVFAGVDPEDDFAGDVGYVSAAYKGSLAIAPALADFPLGWAGIHRFAGIVRTVPLIDRRSKEEIALEDQIWGRYLSTPEYVSLKADALQALRTGRPIRIPVAAKHVNRYLQTLLAQWAMDMPEAVEDRTNRIISASNYAAEVRPVQQAARQVVDTASSNGGYEAPKKLTALIVRKGESAAQKGDLMTVERQVPIVRRSNGKIFTSTTLWDPNQGYSIETFEGFVSQGMVICLVK